MVYGYTQFQFFPHVTIFPPAISLAFLTSRTPCLIETFLCFFLSMDTDLDYGQPWRRSFGETVAYTDWQRDNYYYAVQKLVGNRSKIGLEFDHINLVNYGKMKNALPKAEMTDVGDATMRMRMVKSAEEIALIKNGARIADIGGYTCHAAIAENVPEHEIAMKSTQTMIREIAATYPDVEVRDSKLFMIDCFFYTYLLV